MNPSTQVSAAEEPFSNATKPVMPSFLQDLATQQHAELSQKGTELLASALDHDNLISRLEKAESDRSKVSAEAEMLREENMKLVEENRKLKEQLISNQIIFDSNIANPQEPPNRPFRANVDEDILLHEKTTAEEATKSTVAIALNLEKIRSQKIDYRTEREKLNVQLKNLQKQHDKLQAKTSSLRDDLMNFEKKSTALQIRHNDTFADLYKEINVLLELLEDLKPAVRAMAAIRTREYVYLYCRTHKIELTKKDRELVKKGNSAAHGGDGLLDEGLFKHGFITGMESSRWGSLFKLQYVLDQGQFGRLSHFITMDP